MCQDRRPTVVRRFDDVLEFPAPTQAAIVTLLRRLLRSHDLGADTLRELAEHAAGLSFAQVKDSVDSARKGAILTDRDLPSIDEIATELDHQARGNSL